MFAIRNLKTGKYAKHTGETVNNEGYQYVEYPWKMVDDIEDSQKYKTLAHANEVAFWELDHSEKWVLINVETGEAYDTKLGKHLPV